MLTSGRVEQFRVPSRERVPETPHPPHTHTQETSAAQQPNHTIASCSSGLAQNCLQSSLLLPTLRYQPRVICPPSQPHRHHYTSVLFLHVRPSNRSGTRSPARSLMRRLESPFENSGLRSLSLFTLRTPLCLPPGGCVARGPFG